MQAYLMDTNMKKVSLGMSKEEVKSSIGNVYKALESYREDDSIIDVWGYPDASGGTYRLRFKDGILDSWDHEKIYYPYSPYENGSKSSTATTE